MLSHIKNTSLIALAILLVACSSDSKEPNMDGDAFPDARDNCTQVVNNEQLDLDGDGTGDACDSDIDGDGVNNDLDDLPLDATETLDTDNDGIGDGKDLAINNPDLSYVELDRLIETGRITTIFEGTELFDHLGATNTFENIGDINGDGKDDLAVVLTGEGTSEEGSLSSWTGTVYVHIILGGTSLPALVNKNNIAALSATTIEVANVDEKRNREGVRRSLVRVMPGGDFNNDGLHDFVILNNDPSLGNRGNLYYLYGRDTWPETIQESSLATDYGFSITGAGNDAHYRKIKSAGDLNGDGFQDIFIGFDDDVKVALNTDDTENPYRVIAPHILFGNTIGVYGELDLTNINGINGTQLLDSSNLAQTGLLTGSSLGAEIIALGNFNGDQYDDFAILDGSYRTEGTEADHLYIVYGKPDWSAATDLSELNMQTGFIISGSIDLDNDIYRRFIGGKFSSNQDLNGDGFTDLVINIVGYQNGTEDELQYGWNAVIWGGQPFTKLNTNLLNDINDVQHYLPDGTNRKYGIPHLLPDTNNDGTAELILGVPAYDATIFEDDEFKEGFYGRGGVYVINGSQPFHGDLDFMDLQPKHGFFIHNSNGNKEGVDKFTNADAFGWHVGSLSNWQGNQEQQIFFTMPNYHDSDNESFGDTGQGRAYIMPLKGSLYSEQ